MGNCGCFEGFRRRNVVEIRPALDEPHNRFPVPFEVAYARRHLPVPLDVMCVMTCRSLHHLDFKTSTVSDADRSSAFRNEMAANGCPVEHACVTSRDGDVTKPPIAVAVVVDVLVVAWRGSSTLMDWMQDCSGDAVQCPLWNRVWPNIWVHNGMMGHILHDFTQFLGRLDSLIREYNIREVVFTGHSLGGGLATVAQLSALGQLTMSRQGFGALQATATSESEIRRLASITPELEFRTVAFAAPMVFRIALENISLQQDERRILNYLQDLNVNYVFSQDIVPRLPGHSDFCLAALRECGPGILKANFGSVVGGQISSYVGKTFMNLLDENHKLQVAPTLRILRQYQHTSKIILMDRSLRPSSRLTNAEFVSLPFDVRCVKTSGQRTMGDALQSHHGQGLSRVLFMHKLQSRSITRIKSVAFEEYLYASDVHADIKKERRMALMWIGRHGLEFREPRAATSKRLWEFVPVQGTINYFLIKSVEFNQYLYAASYSGRMLSDNGRQARMAILLDRRMRQEELNDSVRWWELEPVNAAVGVEQFRIRNVKFNEYLYALGDDVLADTGLTWTLTSSKGQRRIAATGVQWLLDSEDQSRWWTLEKVDDLEEDEEVSI